MKATRTAAWNGLARCRRIGKSNVLSKFLSEKNERSSDGTETLLSVSAYTGVSPRSEVMVEGDHLSRAESLEGYKVCYPNDLVMNIMLAWNRGLGFSNHEGIVSPAYSVFRVVDGSSPSFLNYLVRSDETTLYYKAFSAGVIDSRLRLYPDVFSRLYMALPPTLEQLTIAAFLDRETAKIDSLIAEQQRLIGLLKEKRQAVISHAVTKGINPDALMKDTGIAWLGEVPKHWEVKRLGILSALIQTGPFGSQLHSGDYVADETPVINPSNIQDGQIVPDWSNTVGWGIVERLIQHKLLLGDIIFGRRGEMGRCAKVSDIEAGWLCGTGCLNVRLNDSAVSEFVSIYLRTEYVRELLKLESVGSTMDNLNTEILSRIHVPVPPLKEQLAIVAFLDCETTKLDTLTTEAQRAIELLKERRSALISAAVTGKIDVRTFTLSSS